MNLLSGASWVVSAEIHPVVGVMLNLALWFGMRVMFQEMDSVDLLIVEGLPLTFTWPEVSSIDLATAAIAPHSTT